MIVYTVQKDDSLWKIARRYRISLDALIAANPQISDPNYILLGQQINIPELWQTTESEQEEGPKMVERTTLQKQGLRPMQMDPKTTQTRPFIYTAREGDTLEGIGHQFMVPLSRLLYFNLRHSKNEELPAGTRIVVPENEPEPGYPSGPNKMTTRIGRR